MNLLKSIGLWFCQGILGAIQSAYTMFYGLASTRFFSETVVRNISNKLYVFVSVVILFAFAIKLIEAIVNPDLLTDTKKGVTGVLKRTIIGLVLIVAIPNAFNLVYYFQREVLVTGLVEKVVMGYTDQSSTIGSTGGGILTSSLIKAFLYPTASDGSTMTEYSLCGSDENCNYADELVQKDSNYQPYVALIGGNPDVSKLYKIDLKKTWPNTEQSYYTAEVFLLFIASLYILYQVIVLCFDAALRMVNLGILEIISPVIIVAYMGGGTDYLQKWVKMVAEKFLSIFIRIAALAFMIKGMSLMRESSVFNNQSVSGLFQVLVIIGLLRLVKDLPNIISKIFGVDIKDPGGIKGRLGEMAGIGKMASDAWSKMGGYAKGAAKTLGLAPVAGLAAAGKAIDKKAFKGRIGDTAKRIYDSKTGRGVRLLGAGVKSGGKNTGKALSDARKELFKPEIDEENRKEKIRKGNKYNTMLNKASGSRLTMTTDADGKISINFDKSVKGVSDVKAFNDAMITGAGLSDVNEKIVQDCNKKTNDYLAAQRLSNNRSELVSYLESLKSHSTGPGQVDEIDSLIEKINNGSLTNKTTLRDEVAKLNFTDKSVVSGLMDNLITSVGDENMRNQILEAKAQWDSGAMTEEELKNYMHSLAPKGSKMEDVMIEFNNAVDKTSQNVAVQFAARAETLANKSGALGTTTIELNEELQKTKDSMEKAEKTYQERLDSEIGENKEKLEATHNTVKKLNEAKDKQIRIAEAQAATTSTPTP